LISNTDQWTVAIAGDPCNTIRVKEIDLWLTKISNSWSAIVLNRLLNVMRVLHPIGYNNWLIFRLVNLNFTWSMSKLFNLLRKMLLQFMAMISTTSSDYILNKHGDYDDTRHLHFQWWCCYLPWSYWCGFHAYYRGYCFPSLLQFSSSQMKSALILLSVTLGLSIAIGAVLRNTVDQNVKTRHQQYCEQLGKDWHPDCNVEWPWNCTFIKANRTPGSMPTVLTMIVCVGKKVWQEMSTKNGKIVDYLSDQIKGGDDQCHLSDP